MSDIPGRHINHCYDGSMILVPAVGLEPTVWNGALQERWNRRYPTLAKKKRAHLDVRAPYGIVGKGVEPLFHPERARPIH